MKPWKLESEVSVGPIIAEARRRKGMTQRQLAELLDVSQVNISRIENGGDLRLSTLFELARTLRLEPILVPTNTLAAVRGLLDAETSDGAPRRERGRFEK